MERRPLAQYLLTDGIHTSGVKSVENSSTMAKGSKNVLMTGFDKPNAFKGMSLLDGKSGSRLMMPVGASYGGLGAFGDTVVRGSITRMLSVLFFSGSGALYYDGLSLGAAASSILQLKVLESGGWSAKYQAGLTTPSGAVLSARASLGTGRSGRLKSGTYSVRINKIRSATGARSNASETSNLIVTAETNGVGQSARVTFPAIGGNGADAWGVYVSPRNFGSTGAHFLLKEVLESELGRDLSGSLSVINGAPGLTSSKVEFSSADVGRTITFLSGATSFTTTILSVTNTATVVLAENAPFTSSAATGSISHSTIDGVPRSFEIEWTDGDLVGSPLAPIESNPPEACVFNGGLGDVLFVDGAYGDIALGVSAASPGSTIIVSQPGRPEEFPADNLLFPPDPPTALIRGGDGFYYRFGKNSMGVVSYTGGTPALAYQIYWATVGITFPHNACVAEGGRLYAKTGSRGLCRIAPGGDIDASFANPVIDEFENWSDEYTILAWDENSQNVCVMNNFDVWAFNSSQGKWGYCDLTGKVSGRIVSAVTQAGNLFIACEDAATTSIRLYKFNSGTGSVIEQRTDWHFAGATDLIRQIDVTMRSDTLNPITLKIYADESDVAPVLTRTMTPVKTGLVRLPSVRVHVQNVASYLVHLSQSSAGGDCGFERIIVSGVPRALTRRNRNG